MTSIRFRLHFLILIVAGLILWLARDVYLPYWIVNFDFFHFGLMGLLHSTSVVVSLRDRKVVRPIIAVCFVTLATIWSAATPIVALWTSIVWVPILKSAPGSEFNAIFLFLYGSAVGASGYWLLVRVFWLKLLRRTDWLKTVTLCVVATLLACLASEVLKSSGDNMSFMLTVAWWFGFSISLYWSEMTRLANKSAEVVAHISSNRVVS